MMSPTLSAPVSGDVKIMPRLPLSKYAAVLCEAVRDYGFPAVAYDFTGRKTIHHDNMLAVAYSAEVEHGFRGS